MNKTKRWQPRKGQTYASRDEVEGRLLSAGWKFEGYSAALDEGKVIGYDVGVTDEGIWLLVDMITCGEGVCITKIKHLKA